MQVHQALSLGAPFTADAMAAELADEPACRAMLKTVMCAEHLWAMKEAQAQAEAALDEAIIEAAPLLEAVDAEAIRRIEDLVIRLRKEAEEWWARVA